MIYLESKENQGGLTKKKKKPRRRRYKTPLDFTWVILLPLLNYIKTHVVVKIKRHKEKRRRFDWENKEIKNVAGDSIGRDVKGVHGGTRRSFGASLFSGAISEENPTSYIILSPVP